MDFRGKGHLHLVGLMTIASTEQHLLCLVPPHEKGILHPIVLLRPQGWVSIINRRLIKRKVDFGQQALLT